MRPCAGPLPTSPLRCEGPARLTLTRLPLADPDAHYHHTAAEILTAVSSVPSTPQRPSSGTVDMIVAGAGTGGTLSGLSKRLREANPALVSLGVDPVGSILARPESLNVLKEGESSIYKVRAPTSSVSRRSVAVAEC